MRPTSLPLLLSSAVAALLLMPGIASAQHDHAAHAHVTAPVPPPARPWTADATLRVNMQQIHAALERLQHDEPGHLDATLAREQVNVVEKSAADIFAKCKLTPEKDAVLHGMLVPLLTATQKFKTDPADRAALQAMRNAVAAYPRYFAAPGWMPETPHAH